jgi:hypothetical protein
MHRYFYQTLSWICTLLASSQAYGDEDLDARDDLDARIDLLETDMKKIRGETAYGNFGAKLPSANPQVDGYGFFATADFLWWKLYEGGTDYALKNTGAHGDFPIKGTIKHFNFDWEPGFKVGAGYLFEHDAWSAGFEFTFFQTHAHNATHARLPLVGDENLSLISSKGNWHVDFYNLDLTLGKNAFVSSALALRPFFGLALTWINQHRHLHFHTITRERINLKGINDFQGVGPKLGLNAQFFLSERLSFYGDVSGNLLWGNFHVKERERNRTNSTEIYSLRYSLHRMVPSCAFGLGATYELPLQEDQLRFRVKAGYESQYWWRQNQLPIFDSDALTFHRNSEDLSLQGLTIELRLDF